MIQDIEKIKEISRRRTEDKERQFKSVYFDGGIRYELSFKGFVKWDGEGFRYSGGSYSLSAVKDRGEFAYPRFENELVTSGLTNDLDDVASKCIYNKSELMDRIHTFIEIPAAADYENGWKKLVSEQVVQELAGFVKLMKDKYNVRLRIDNDFGYVTLCAEMDGKTCYESELERLFSE